MPLRHFRSVILALSPLLVVGIIAATLALRLNSERVADMRVIQFGDPAAHQPQGA